MLEAAFRGGKRYWILLGVWAALIGAGLYAWGLQYTQGLTVTGMSQDVTWGIYIAQFTFLVGVAASAVMVVLPYYLHSYKDFGKMVILGEGLAIASVIMCMLFIFVDMGQPNRVTNVILHPTFNSMMFWDMVALGGYLVLNVIISFISLSSERRGEPPPRWIKPVILLSIPWAVSIHTVTAFLYSGLAARPFWMTAILAPRFLASAFAAGPALLILLSIPWAISIHTVTAFIYSGLAARPFWMTAILAPRFLASAFASGPALLILLCLVLKRFTRFDAGREAVQKLALIATYAVLVNIFFVLMEFFTAFYSAIPHHIEHFAYLYVGLEGHRELVPWMWLAAVLIVVAAVMLLNQRLRNSPGALAVACVAIVASIWIEKGLGMVVTGFVPSPLGEVSGYAPTLPEFLITLGIYGLGALLVTVLYKVALSVRGQVSA